MCDHGPVRPLRCVCAPVPADPSTGPATCRWCCGAADGHSVGSRLSGYTAIFVVYFFPCPSCRLESSQPVRLSINCVIRCGQEPGEFDPPYHKVAIFCQKQGLLQRQLFDTVVDWLTGECFVVSDDLGYLNTSTGRMRSDHLQVVAGLERLPKNHMRQKQREREYGRYLLLLLLPEQEDFLDRCLRAILTPLLQRR